MESVNSVLAGFQESLLPEVERFWIENPDPRKMEWKYGDRFRWRGRTGTISGHVFGEPELRYCKFDDGNWETVPMQELEYTPEHKVGDRVRLKNGEPFIGAGTNRFAVGEISQIAKRGYVISNQAYAGFADVELTPEQSDESETRVQVARPVDRGILAAEGEHTTPMDLPAANGSSTSAMGTRKPRHSKKGNATGWIEERKGNTKRRVPCTSFYYCWYEVEDLSYDGSGGETRRVKRKEYLQNHLISDVSRMVNDRKPYTEILKVIHQRSRFDDRRKFEREWV